MGHCVGGQSSDLAEQPAIDFGAARAQGEEGVAVEGEMRRADGPRQAVVGHLGDLGGLGLGPVDVGGDEADGRVLARRCVGEQRARADLLHPVGEGAAVFGARSREQDPGLGIDDVADGVDGGERGHDDAVREAQGGRAQAALHGAVSTEQLTDGCSRARARVALRNRIGGSLPGGLVARQRVGTDRRFAESQIVKDGRRNDGDNTRAGSKADSTFFEVAHDAVRSGESVSAASGEDNGVCPLDGHLGTQQIGFAASGSASANVDAGDGAAYGENDGAAGRPLVGTEVTDFEACDVGQGSGGHALGIGGHRAYRI